MIPLIPLLLMVNNAIIDEDNDNNDNNDNNEEVDEHADNDTDNNTDNNTDNKTNQSGNQVSTYIGTNLEKWNLMIGTINTLHINLFPKIFTKHATNQNWIGVHEDFPNTEFDKQAMDDAFEAINFIRKEINDNNIGIIEGTRLEQSAISIFQSTENFFKILIIH